MIISQNKKLTMLPAKNTKIVYITNKKVPKSFGKIQIGDPTVICMDDPKKLY